ncbi:MAG: response regulator [Bacteroidales bacterium]|nr:response regulator [Bacteroidales bacterium]
MKVNKKKLGFDISQTEESIKGTHLKNYQISILFIAISFPITGLIINYIAKDMYDPLIFRLILSSLFFIFLAATYLSKFVVKYFHIFFNIFLTFILFWSIFIAHNNDYSFATTIVFLLVASINSVALSTYKYIPFYSAFTLTVTLLFLYNSGIEPIHSFAIVVSMLTFQFVAYIVLKSKSDVDKNLIESEEKFRLLVQALGEGVGIINKDDVFVLTNPSAHGIFEVEPSEIVGQPITSFLTKKGIEQYSNKILEKNDQISISFELEIITPKKNTKTLLITETNFTNKNKSFHGTILVFRDITERIETENELLTAKEKAEESDRLKSAFLANMSHEIRTPMNSILGFAHLLEQHELTGDQQQKYINIIQKSGTRMLNILNDIIDISKIEAGLMTINSEDTNINEQIKYIYTFFKHEAEAKGISISFRNSLPTNKAVIRTDSEKFYAILTNLVKNAIKYSNTGHIELGYNPINSSTRPESLTFYVKDTGIGIPIDRQKAIFERFVQADIEDRKAYQGAGLGLSITKAYLEMLGGKIWVESEEGVGTTFYFTLPYNAELEEKTEVKNFIETSLVNNPIDHKTSKLKVLIAEDDVPSEMLISIIVEELSSEILKVTTGIEAVEACRNHPDIDLVLMDIQMPEMNGYEATRQIRSFNKNVIIIAETAYGLSGDREKSIKAGCNDYIPKPINKDDFLELIHKYFKE